MGPLLRKFFIYLILFLTPFLVLGCSGDENDSSARFTISTPPFPEIQEMAAKVSVTLEIAGKVCPLIINTDNWSLSGSCSGIPVGSHSFTLLYKRSDLGVTIASANGDITLNSDPTNNITLTTLKKDQDDDGDGYSNLVEAMFETDPKNIASKPGIPPFSAPTSYSTGSGPSAIALGDLNNDTFLNVVAADGGSDTVTILLGNGDGTLKPGFSLPSGLGGGEPLNPVDLSLTQLNPGTGPGEDDHLDIVVINSGEGGTHTGSLSVFLGNGDGTFLPAQVNAFVGDQPVALALGDLNGDGDPDVVTGNFSSQNLSVLLGGGDGTFTLASIQPTLSGDVTALTLGDLDGDTILDLVASTQSSLSYSVLLGIGDGSFGGPRTTTIGEIISVALQKLNANTRLDLIAAHSENTISVLLGNGDDTFQTPTFYKVGKTPGSLAFADLDKDGNLDLVTENEKEGIVAVLMGMGAGSFRSPVFFEAGTSPSWVALGDLNGDGGFDIVFTDRTSGTVNVLLTK